MNKISLVPLQLLDMRWIKSLGTAGYGRIINENGSGPTPKQIVECYKYYFNIDKNKFIVGILIRQDQRETLNNIITNWYSNEFASIKELHKSRDFTNLNYCHDTSLDNRNYLNFYLFEVTFNV